MQYSADTTAQASRLAYFAATTLRLDRAGIAAELRRWRATYGVRLSDALLDALATQAAARAVELV